METRELHVSVTSNLQIKQNKNLSIELNFFDPSVLKIMSTYVRRRGVLKKMSKKNWENVSILKVFAKKKCIFRLLKVSFKGPPRFYFHLFYDL